MSRQTRSRAIALAAALSLVGATLVSATAANAFHSDAYVTVPITSASPSMSSPVIDGVVVEVSYVGAADGYVEVQVEKDGAQSYAPLPLGLGTLRLVQTGLYSASGLVQATPGLESEVCVDISQLTNTSSAEVWLLDSLANVWVPDLFVQAATNVYCADVASSAATVVVAAPLLGVDPADIDLLVTRVATPMPLVSDSFGVGPQNGAHLSIVATNNTNQPIILGTGADLRVQDQDEKLWRPTTYGLAGDDFGLEGIATFSIDPWSTATFEMPDFPGKTYTFWALDFENPGLSVPLQTFETGGLFTPVIIDIEDNSYQIGSVATFAGERVFPGATTTVVANGLIPGETYDLWLTPGVDYLSFLILGGILADEAVPVGTATVDTVGRLATAFTVPQDAQPGDGYQLMIGEPATRSWPAGTIAQIIIVAPEFGATVNGPTAASPMVDISLNGSTVSFLFPTGTSGDATTTTTASASATGPAAVGFTVSTSPPVYYHLSSTATFSGSVEVCVPVGSQVPSALPRLYHYELTGSVYAWVDITSRRTATTVCGLTSSFSPFVVGTPDAPILDVVLANKKRCKNGGWATSTLPMFTNESQCVSFFAAQKPKSRR